MLISDQEKMCADLARLTSENAALVAAVVECRQVIAEVDLLEIPRRTLVNPALAYGAIRAILTSPAVVAILARAEGEK
jgi:hypothetical protein